MSLRFFVDHCVPTDVVVRLRQDGRQVFVLREHLPPRSIDTVVIAKAQELDCILLSLNGDFSDIVCYPPASYGGIVSFQLHNHPEILPRLLDRPTHYITAHPDQATFKHRLFLVEAHRIRIRS